MWSENSKVRLFFWSADVFSLFLAVQDSSIGDSVSQSLRQTFDFSVFRALQSCGRLLRDFCETFGRLLRDF